MNGYIANDHSQLVLKKNEKYFGKGKGGRIKPTNTRLGHQVLFIDNGKYRWDELHRYRIKITKGAPAVNQIE